MAESTRDLSHDELQRLTRMYDDMSDQEIEERFFRGLRHQTQTISLRLSEELLQRVKAEADRRHVAYQALIKMLVEVGLDRLQRAS